MSFSMCLRGKKYFFWFAWIDSFSVQDRNLCFGSVEHNIADFDEFSMVLYLKFRNFLFPLLSLHHSKYHYIQICCKQCTFLVQKAEFLVLSKLDNDKCRKTTDFDDCTLQSLFTCNKSDKFTCSHRNQKFQWFSFGTEESDLHVSCVMSRLLSSAWH